MRGCTAVRASRPHRATSRRWSSSVSEARVGSPRAAALASSLRDASSYNKPISQSSSGSTSSSIRNNVITQERPVSFGGGPGAVRPEILAQTTELLPDLLELSHRDVGGRIQGILSETSQLIRRLLVIPNTHRIMFVPGGAHAQFAAVPLNFGARPKALVLDTGQWSTKALEEQAKFAEISRYAPPLRSSPPPSKDKHSPWTSADVWRDLLAREAPLRSGHDYVYACSNETMAGFQLHADPPPGTGVNFVLDMTSDLFSRPVDWSSVSVAFASGGKNAGPAGYAIVVARDDVIHRADPSPHLPGILSWREMSMRRPKVANLYNTPPMLSIGIAKLVLEDLERRGGLAWAQERTQRLSAALYREIDESDGFYVNTVLPEFRSKVSVCFEIAQGNEDLLLRFKEGARERGMVQLDNHPSVGGVRASIYNGVPSFAVEKLAQYMREFRKSAAAQLRA